MFFMNVLAASLYLFRCDFHFLASALPICTKTRLPNGRIRTSYKPFPHNVIYFLLQILVATELNCGMFPYLAIGLTVVFDGIEMIRNLG
jgi:hypothetical protein